jgi:hypothetical protein
MAVLVTLLAVVVALLGLLVAGLLRSHAEILRALHELGAGVDPDAPRDPAATSAGTRSPSLAHRRDTRGASDISGTSPTDDAVSIAIVGAPRPTLLAFLTTGCTTCADFWTAFADERRRVPGDARLVVVLKGANAESPVRARKMAPRDVPVVMSDEAWDAYDVPVAPYFVFVDGPTGEVVGEGAAATWAQLTSMLDRAIEEAGVDLGRRRGRRNDNRSREARADRDLRASGIEPGDPSLYPSRTVDEGRVTQ